MAIRDFATEATIAAPGTGINALKWGTILDLNPNISAPSSPYHGGPAKVYTQESGVFMPATGMVQFEVTEAFTSAGNPSVQLLVLASKTEDPTAGAVDAVQVGCGGGILHSDFTNYAYYTFRLGALQTVGTTFHVPFSSTDLSQAATVDPKDYRFLLAAMVVTFSTVGFTGGQMKARIVGAVSRAPANEYGTHPTGMIVK